ncbi:hypothetical protein [Paenibacillus sp. GCM10027629]|uniref:hypothetical protein n=1 Tax=Paenibacillus sp. GCM10027629 TaxID=3273414 RepID=UPI0036D427B5
MMRKHYAQGVIIELQRIGYSCEEAKAAFFRHDRGMKRLFGLEPNVRDFAMLIDEFEHAMKRKFDPNNPDHIYVGHIRDRIKKTERGRRDGMK